MKLIRIYICSGIFLSAYGEKPPFQLDSSSLLESAAHSVLDIWSGLDLVRAVTISRADRCEYVSMYIDLLLSMYCNLFLFSQLGYQPGDFHDAFEDLEAMVAAIKDAFSELFYQTDEDEVRCMWILMGRIEKFINSTYHQ